MKSCYTRHLLPIGTIGLAILGVLAVNTQAQWADAQNDVPAFHAKAPVKGEALPPILSGAQITGPNFQQKLQTHAYELAARIPRVLYQQPCYCHCDRSMKHTSLHSCFSSLHGAQCTTCMEELYYTYKMTKLKKTPAQIRAGIIHEDFKNITEKEALSLN